MSPLIEEPSGRSTGITKIFISTHDACHAEIHHFVEEANQAQSQFLFGRLRLNSSEREPFCGKPVDAKEAYTAAVSLKTRRGLEPDDILIMVFEDNLADDQDDEYFCISRNDVDLELPSQVALISLYYLNPASSFMKEGSSWLQALGDGERKRLISDSILLLLLCAVAGETTSLGCHKEILGCIMDYCQTPMEISLALKGGFQFCEEHCRTSMRQDPNGLVLLSIADRLTKRPLRHRRLFNGYFDVALLYSSGQEAAVRQFGGRLKDRGIVPWVDWEQAPGVPWKGVLKSQIDKVKAMALFVGGAGSMPWDDGEVVELIRTFQRRRAPVILAIISAAGITSEIPAWLQTATKVDFRVSDPDPLNLLIWIVTGPETPEASSKAQVPAQSAPAGAFTNSSLVMSLHGIRTRGNWQKELDQELSKAGFLPVALDYGLFRALQLVWPASRQKQIEWFRDQYTQVGDRYRTQPPSIIAHSFGTYLVAHAIEYYEELEFDQIILCGSIVPSSFPWSDLIKAGRVRRVLNECAKRDLWVRLVGWVVKDAGASGVYGFEDSANGCIIDRPHPKFRHSDYFYRLNYERNWIPFLKGQEPRPVVLGERRETNYKFRLFLLLLVMLALTLVYFLRRFL
jgi:pimeloyl-ACP methyl ester carboxylesterase